MSAVKLPELVLVEDNLDDEIMSLMGISKSGIPCHVTVRRDGIEALEHLLGTKGSSPTLVLLDYQLPRLNGFEILMRLRSNDKTRLIPIVIVSGSNAGCALEQCYRGGANSCVTKPDDPNEYVERMAGIARYWLTVNQPFDDRSLQATVAQERIQ